MKLKKFFLLFFLFACGTKPSQSNLASESIDPDAFAGALIYFDKSDQKLLGIASAGLICDSALLTAAHNTSHMEEADVYFCNHDDISKLASSKAEAETSCQKIESYAVSPYAEDTSINFGLVQHVLVADIAVAKVSKLNRNLRYPKILKHSKISDWYQIKGFGGGHNKGRFQLFFVSIQSYTSKAQQNLLISEVDQRVIEGDSGSLLVMKNGDERSIAGVTTGYYQPYGRLSDRVRSYFSSVPENKSWIEQQANEFGCSF